MDRGDGGRARPGRHAGAFSHFGGAGIVHGPDVGQNSSRFLANRWRLARSKKLAALKHGHIVRGARVFLPRGRKAGQEGEQGKLLNAALGRAVNLVFT
jgi:hypothetical protein